MKLELKPCENNNLISCGTLETFETEMVTYEDHRKRMIRVWLPEDYDGVKRFPVIYMHDGEALFENDFGFAALDMDKVLTALKAEGISAIVVGIDSGRTTRGGELTPPFPRGESGAVINGVKIPILEPSTTPDYARFVVEYLKPDIDEKYMTLPDMENTCIGGVSAGGSASFYMMLTYPEIFGKAIICSPGFPMFDPEKFLSYVENYDIEKLKDHRLVFYNGDQGIDVTSVDLVLAVYRILKKRGLDRRQTMFIFDSRQTHYNAAWRKYMPEFLRFLFLQDNSAEFPPERP